MNRKTMPQLWIVIVAILLVGLILLSAIPASASKVFLPKGFTPSIISLYDLGPTKDWWEGLGLPLLGYKDYVYFDVGILTVIKETTPEAGISFDVPRILSLLPGIPYVNLPVTVGYGISRNVRDECTMHGFTIRKSW